MAEINKYYKNDSEQAIVHCNTQEQVDWCVNNNWVEISGNDFDILKNEGYDEWEWDVGAGEWEATIGYDDYDV